MHVDTSSRIQLAIPFTSSFSNSSSPSHDTALDFNTNSPTISEHRTHTRDATTFLTTSASTSSSSSSSSSPSSSSSSSSSSSVGLSLSSYPILMASSLSGDMGRDTCADADYGVGLLKRWKSNRIQACDGISTSTSSSPSSSSVEYYQIRQIRHGGDDFFLALTNLLFEPSRTNSQSLLSVYCRPTSELYTYGDYANGNNNDAAEYQGHLNDKFANQGQISSFIRSLHIRRTEDMEHIINNNINHDNILVDDTPTLFVDRDCNPPFNPFHCSPDLVNAFMMCHMFNISFSDLRIVFLDESPPSTMIDVWRLLGGRGVYTRSEWNSASRSRAPFDKPILLRRAFFNIPPGSNFIWKDAWVHDVCNSRAPILLGFNKLASQAFSTNANSLLSSSSSSFPSNRRRIILCSRKNAKYRRIANEDELILSLRRSLPEWEAEAVDLGSYEFSKQIAIVNSGSILVGMHGAALALILFIKNIGGTALLELFRAESDHPRMYENMALRLGMKYESWINPDPSKNTDLETTIDVDAVTKIVLTLANAQLQSV